MIKFSRGCYHIELQELTDEKEIILRQACGLDYPEPNVIFALCRGSWSSPAVSEISKITFYIHQVLVASYKLKLRLAVEILHAG